MISKGFSEAVAQTESKRIVKLQIGRQAGRMRPLQTRAKVWEKKGADDQRPMRTILKLKFEILLTQWLLKICGND